MSEISPDLFMDAVLAYQQTAAIKAALELDLFSEIRKGNETAETLARTNGAAVRGVRILCDYLTVRGHLEKHVDRYRLTFSTMWCAQALPSSGVALNCYSLNCYFMCLYRSITSTKSKSRVRMRRSSVRIQLGIPIWFPYRGWFLLVILNLPSTFAVRAVLTIIYPAAAITTWTNIHW